jgi:hypothetical protein
MRSILNRSAVLIAALLLSCASLWAGVVAQAGATITGYAQDAFGNVYAPMLTFVPIQLFDTGIGTTLPAQIQIIVNTTNSHGFYNGATGQFAASNLTCGLWNVTPSGARSFKQIFVPDTTNVFQFNWLIINPPQTIIDISNVVMIPTLIAGSGISLETNADELGIITNYTIANSGVGITYLPGQNLTAVTNGSSVTFNASAGGGLGVYFPFNFTTNAQGVIDVTNTLKQLSTNNLAGMTNLAGSAIVSTIPYSVLPANLASNQNVGNLNFLAGLNVSGNQNVGGSMIVGAIGFNNGSIILTNITNPSFTMEAGNGGYIVNGDLFGNQPYWDTFRNQTYYSIQDDNHSLNYITFTNGDPTTYFGGGIHVPAATNAATKNAAFLMTDGSGQLLNGIGLTNIAFFGSTNFGQSYGTNLSNGSGWLISTNAHLTLVDENGSIWTTRTNASFGVSNQFGVNAGNYWLTTNGNTFQSGSNSASSFYVPAGQILPVSAGAGLSSSVTAGFLVLSTTGGNSNYYNVVTNLNLLVQSGSTGNTNIFSLQSVITNMTSIQFGSTYTESAGGLTNTAVTQNIYSFGTNSLAYISNLSANEMSTVTGGFSWYPTNYMATLYGTLDASNFIAVNGVQVGGAITNTTLTSALVGANEIGIFGEVNLSGAAYTPTTRTLTITSGGNIVAGTNVNLSGTTLSTYNLDQEYNLVTGYGADPTGGTYSDVALANALADYATHGGGWITLPPGTYCFHCFHIPTNNANAGKGYGGGIRGAGAFATHIQLSSTGAGTNDGGLIDYRGNLTPFCIQHLWLDYTNSAVTMPIIFTLGTLHIDDVQFYSENGGHVCTNVQWGGRAVGWISGNYTNAPYSGYGSYENACVAQSCGVMNQLNAAANGIVIENNYISTTISGDGIPVEVVDGQQYGANCNVFQNNIYELAGSQPVTVLISNSYSTFGSIGLIGNKVVNCDFDDATSGTQVGVATASLYGTYTSGNTMNGLGIPVLDYLNTTSGPLAGLGATTLAMQNSQDGGLQVENTWGPAIIGSGAAGNGYFGIHGTNDFIVYYTNTVSGLDAFHVRSSGTTVTTNGGFFSSSTGYASYSSTRNSGYNYGTLGTTNTLAVDNWVSIGATNSTIVRFDFYGHAYATNINFTGCLDVRTIANGGFFTNNGTLTVLGSHP